MQHVKITSGKRLGTREFLGVKGMRGVQNAKCQDSVQK